MALATTLGSPIATRASTSTRTRAPVAHAATSAHPCHCDMSPYTGAPRHGGWVNTALPGPKGTITNARRVRNPLTGGGYFSIAPETPMLDGNGDSAVRGWVLGSTKAVGTRKKSLRHQIQIDWGQQKKMPPPNLGGAAPPSTKPVLYYYAFSVVVQRTPSPAPPGGLPKPTYPARGKPIHGIGASGWIPASCLVGKTPAKKKALKALMACTGECMDRFDKQPKRKRLFHPRPHNPTHLIAATSKAISSKLEHRYYTRVHQGNASHYLSRSADKVSPEGYVNVCYNLPDLTENKINVGGVSCDTVRVGTPFYQISKVRQVDVKLCNFKNEYKYRQRFVFGAIAYVESASPLEVAYRYGWVAKRSLRKVP
jgi:hypothetical protein